jgi:hypothetical protein
MSEVAVGVQVEPTTSFLEREGSIVPAEKRVADYMLKAGVITEPGLGNGRRASITKKVREQNYQNVECLLKRYRVLRKTLDLIKSELEDRIKEDATLPATEENFFERISQNLELMSIDDERRFKSTYLPQIENARRIEIALSSLNFGMKILMAQDEDEYNILRETYIEGTRKPPVRTILNKLNYTSMSSYYIKIEEARRDLTIAMFGCANSRAELTSILVFLRQQYDDSYFPEFI